MTTIGVVSLGTELLQVNAGSTSIKVQPLVRVVEKIRLFGSFDRLAYMSSHFLKLHLVLRYFGRRISVGCE